MASQSVGGCREAVCLWHTNNYGGSLLSKSQGALNWNGSWANSTTYGSGCLLALAPTFIISAADSLLIVEVCVGGCMVWPAEQTKEEVYGH